MTTATSDTTSTDPVPTDLVTGNDTLDDAPSSFEDHLVDVLNHGALCLMTSIGHRTGLFDTMADLGPADATTLAAAAGLDERYVTEWLGAMTTGRFVAHEPTDGTYTLPAEHARSLTRAHPTYNLAVFAQYIPLLGANEDDIVGCFQHGGGLDYDAFPRFQEVMEQDSGQSVLSSLREHILPLVPGLVERLQRGVHVIDIGCGRGRALNELAGWFPNSTFAGYDLSEEAVGYARGTAARRGLDNVTFDVADAARLTETVAAGRADVITTFDAVHDQADPVAVVRGIRELLADGGVYLAQDIDATSTHHGDLDHPIGPLLYTISCLHCMTVSLARGGAGLGAMWGRRRAQQLFREAGFSDIRIETLAHDPQNAYYICRP